MIHPTKQKFNSSSETNKTLKCRKINKSCVIPPLHTNYMTPEQNSIKDFFIYNTKIPNIIFLYQFLLTAKYDFVLNKQ